MTSDQIAATAAPAEDNDWQGPPGGDPRGREPAVADYDMVDDTGDASFPASDPPSWWGGR